MLDEAGMRTRGLAERRGNSFGTRAKSSRTKSNSQLCDQELRGDAAVQAIDDMLA